MGNNYQRKSNPKKELGQIEKWFWDTFKIKIKKRERKDIKRLLKNWAQSPNVEDRKKLFDVAADHESQEIQQLAQTLLSTSPSNYWSEYIDLWVYRPVNSLKETIRELINNRKCSLKDDLRATALLLLGEIEDAQEADLDFIKLEDKIRSEPLMLSHIDSHLTQINKRNLLRQLSSRTRKIKIQEENLSSDIIPLPNKVDESWRALRGNDLDVAWRNLLSSSFSCIIHYIGLFAGYGWKPKIITEKEIYEILRELVGFGGWTSKNDIMYLLCGVKTDFAQLGLKIKVNPEVYTSPNYLTRKNHKNDLFSFTEPFYDPLETYIVSLLYDGKKVIQIEIPKVLQSRLEEFTFNNLNSIELPNVNLSLPMHGIFSLVFPSIENGLEELKWIKDTLKELNNNIQDLTLRLRRAIPVVIALEKLLEYHGMKNFNLKEVEVKNLRRIDESRKSIIKDNQKKQAIIVGLDFGNSTTALAIMDYKTGKFINPKKYTKKKFWESIEISKIGFLLPSVIAYRSGGRKIIGKKAKKYWTQKTTFKEMKKSLRSEYRSSITVDGRNILAPEATRHFLEKILINLNLSEFDVRKIAFAHPINAPSGYQILLRECLADFFSCKTTDIFSIDEATASCLGMKNKLRNISKSIVTIDAGAGTTDVSVLNFKKIEKFETETIVYARRSFEKGGRDIDKTIYESILDYIHKNQQHYDKNFYEKIIDDDECLSSLLQKCQEVKHAISNNKSETEIITIRNKKIKYHISKKVIEKLLKKSFYDRFFSNIDSIIHSAKTSGSPEITTVLLLGGAYQWEGLQSITKKVFRNEKPKIITEYDPFVVTKGIIFGSIGLNIDSEIPYDIGIIRNQEKSEVFHKMLNKNNTRIPTNVRCYKILKEYSQEKVLLEFYRLRRFLVDENETVLVYDNSNRPRLQTSQPYDYIEPLSAIPLEFPTNKLIGLEINALGEIFLLQVDNSKNIEKRIPIGRAL
jgi:molecular chaperone DnaK (HSP70)